MAFFVYKPDFRKSVGNDSIAEILPDPETPAPSGFQEKVRDMPQGMCDITQFLKMFWG
jgi:hypothetical protein